ncbi:efflux transporter outer membrane subunit [Neisseria sp.]|uniref:efflux transporter outer membrane subunit n=1 Tax=Neisseria sp. TaxID=192066 RepID=UPI0026DC709A|nr:efflux transporter outer membrane subunit [Neisseria sp.]MDO4907953.1 efflux transporter outer membrane subunit [Neisseria sp.]
MALRQPTTAVLLSLLLAACAGTDVPLNSQIAVPQSFDQAQAAKGSTDIAQWWRQWNDPVLSSLIEQGLRQSHDIRIAESRLNEARAVSRATEADKGPAIGLNADAARLDARMSNPLSSETRAVIGQIPQAAALNSERYRLKGSSLTGGFTASWEPDVFGKKRSDADAARYAALGAQEQVYGAQMLIAADIADNYFKARAAQARQQTAGRTTATLQRMVRYVEGRFKAGQLTAYEVSQARSRLSAAQARESTLAAEYAAYVRSIAVLAGQTPQGFSLPEGRKDILANQPAAPAGQTPQGLLERRPDLRARAAEVNAYAAKLASAKADLLPRFSIEFLGQGSISIDGSADLKGWGSLLRAGIQVPLFTNGRIQANIAAADARLQTALLQYDQTLLKALGEVDTAYQTHTALTRQNQLLATAQRQAAKQAADTEKLFKYGHKTLDEALRAQLNEQEMQDNLTQSRLARAQTLTGLYKALGGGWAAD